jgi:hypothetical protein
MQIIAVEHRLGDVIASVDAAERTRGMGGIDRCDCAYPLQRGGGCLLIYKTPRSPRPPLARKQNDRRKQNNPETTPKQPEKEGKERGKKEGKHHPQSTRRHHLRHLPLPCSYIRSSSGLRKLTRDHNRRLRRASGSELVLWCFLLAAAHSMFHRTTARSRITSPRARHPHPHRPDPTASEACPKGPNPIGDSNHPPSPSR